MTLVVPLGKSAFEFFDKRLRCHTYVCDSDQAGTAPELLHLVAADSERFPVGGPDGVRGHSRLRLDQAPRPRRASWAPGLRTADGNDWTSARRSKHERH